MGRKGTEWNETKKKNKKKFRRKEKERKEVRTNLLPGLVFDRKLFSIIHNKVHVFIKSLRGSVNKRKSFEERKAFSISVKGFKMGDLKKADKRAKLKEKGGRRKKKQQTIITPSMRTSVCSYNII